MHVYRRRGALALAAVLAAAACADNVTAVFSQFSATLSTDQEPTAPTGATGASGSGTCTFSPAPTARPVASTTTVSCTISYSGLSGAPVYAILNAGAPGATGTNQVWLCAPANFATDTIASPAVGTAKKYAQTTHSPAGVATCPATSPIGPAGVFSATGSAGLVTPDSLYGLMLNSSGTAGTYLNIGTANNPLGEIRGIMTHPIP